MSELVDEATLAALAKAEVERHTPVDDSTIDYGCVSANLEGHRAETFYISTAISYTNGYPHVGHAYEFLSADVLARYHRVLGYDTYFCTGSDEHGQKVAAAAEKTGRTPLDHCNIYVNGFKALMQRLCVKFDKYIRTTDSYHEETCRRLWTMCGDKGDIYLNNYEGWYSVREEMFVSDADAEAAGYKDIASGADLKRVKEESYFFKMSAYCERLIAHIETNPTVIEPEQFRNQILSRLKKEGLRDLSISRTTFDWGITVPDGYDDGHVMYVWFDALTNYISGVHGLDADHPLSRYWPAQRHIVGKDIIWFHCVIWPCMLMSAEIPLPESVFSHGFVNAADGRKMSKSFDNCIDPHEVLDKFDIDTIRYYMCASTPYGTDLSFSEAALIDRHNSELADTLGNLLHRALNLNEKYSGGLIPDTTHDAEYGTPFDAAELIKDVSDAMKGCEIHNALFKTMNAVRATNGWITGAEPWKMKGENEHRRPAIVRTCLEACYIFAHFLAPVIPLAAAKIFERVGTPITTTDNLRTDFYNLKVGAKTTIGDVLFKKIEVASDVSKDVTASVKRTGSGGKTSTGGGGGGGGGSGGGVKKGASDGTPELSNDQPHFSRLEFKVGRITKVWHHETADKLFCEEIDVGEESPRQIASGLRAFYTTEEMLGRLVVVVTNLKESKLQGFVSAGMVLAAKSSDGTKVELVTPPADAVIGERVMVEGTEGPVWPAGKIKKLKSFESVAPDLASDANCVACYQGKPLKVEAGICTVPSIASSPIA